MKKSIIPLAVLLALSICALLVLDWAMGAPGGEREVVFRLERGWGARETAEALADSGLVRSVPYLLWRARETGLASSFQAGSYLLSTSMPPDTILAVISSGRVIPVPTSWVTIPEGLTLEETRDLLCSSLGLGQEELDSLLHDEGFAASLGIPGFEGYLHPETYEFADTLGAAEVVSRMVGTGLERWEPGWDTLVRASGLEPHEAVILASIVEREARLPDERPVIAGVFLSRLRRGMRLESCATVQYALGEVRETLTYADLRIESPWNTYLHEGLPPAPICSPGLSAIEAVVSPDTSTGYLYFVSRDDGTGGHLFASTLAGHNANIRLARSGGH